MSLVAGLSHPYSLEETTMNRYKFLMDDGTVDWVIAKSFREACDIWAQFGKDPRAIMAMSYPS